MFGSLGGFETNGRVPPGEFGNRQERGFGPNENGGGMFEQKVNQKLLSYILVNQGQSQYLVAGPSSRETSQLILNSDKKIINLGGFNGGDQVMSLTKFQGLVKNKDLKFVIVGGNQGSGTGGIEGGFGDVGKNKDIYDWVKANCKTVDTILWSEQTDATAPDQQNGGLYQCTFE